jgi:DNA-binding response OmpR family regulator
MGGGQVRRLNEATFFVPMEQSQRILIVSDSAHLSFARAALEQRGFAVTIAKDRDTAFETLLQNPFDLVVTDSGRAENSIEFIKRVRATPQLTGILILIIAEWGTGEPTLALSAGADAYEPSQAKPIDPNRLITSIERLLVRQVSAAN